MQKTYLMLLTAILTALGNVSLGQTNTFPNEGNVGIGTSNPTEKLDVRGNVLWDGFNSGNSRALKIGYSGGNYGGIGYNLDFTSTTGIFNRPLNDHSSYLEFWNGGFRFFGSSNSSSALGVNLGGSGANLAILTTITRSGNFGIGTYDPVAKLSVSNNGAEGIEMVPGSASNVSRMYAYNRTSNLYNSLIFNTADIDFRNDLDFSRLFIQNSSGNVGVGTTNPTQKLTVDGGIKLNGQSQGLSIEYASLSETISGATTILGNNVKAGASYNSVKRFFSPDDAGSYLALNYLNGITFHTGITSALNTDILSTENEVMRITQTGNVGIGTTDPKGYKLAVAGNMIAESVKVKLRDTWPDYVFSDSYKNPSLEGIEKHIKEKGYLPGIPSASDVKANGIDIGEMNAKLLQKIEELTLHLIELNSIVKNQQNRINTLEQKSKQ